MKKSLVVFSILSIAFLGSSKAWSQDDVVIDLSVLGEVGSAPNVQPESAYQPIPAYDMPVYERAPTVPAAQGAIPAPSTQVQPGSVSTILNLPPLEPQFPVVKPRPKAVRKTRPVSKPKPVIEEKKIEIEDTYNIDSVVSEPTTEEVAKVLNDANKEQEEADRIISEDVAAKSSTNDENMPENSNGSIAAEETLNVVEEPAVETKSIEVEKAVEEETIKENISNETTDEVSSANAPTQLVTPTQLVVANKEIVESNLDSLEVKTASAMVAVEDKTTSELNSAESMVVVGNSVEAKEIEDEVAAKTEIEVKEEVVSNRISFSGEETTLTEADKDKIVKIVSAFENPGQNKIGIFSYNLDNGEDVFKRKRQSLNRATEVRSFLISKGYKNYSIKVVNVDESSDKINTVEIVEIK